MATEIKIPVPDQTTEEVRILRWLKKVGDIVKRAEVILEIETEKSAIEVEASADGVILELLAQENDTVPVGKIVGFIGQPGEKLATAVAPTSASPSPSVAATAPTVPVVQMRPAESSSQRKAVSPNARRIAKELGVDIAQIPAGTGQGGRIVGEDVKHLAASGRQASALTQQVESYGPQAGTDVPLSKMRRAIATNLQKSWQQSPHFNVAMTINMTRAINFREQFNRNKPKPQQLSVNDLVVKACALTLRHYPAVNSSFAGDKILCHSDVNIGIATAVAEGLVVPVMVKADAYGWDQLQSQTKTLAAEARNGKIVGAGKGTFTISNLGMFGVDYFTAIVNPPECAILAVGAVADKVVAVNKMIAVVPALQVVLCSDHRLIDGATAAQFLKSFREYLEEKID
ncbi:MAG: dihydrolipoamide acetyltransferase family protein [Sedimentisphaerales bacterium]|nr:dihydrolipoamide acetyltransferase family protein [Sedimentisphaerales bacterium]